MNALWGLGDLTDQSGKRFVVTGATGGLGKATATALARAGAAVVLVGRNEIKLAEVTRQIEQTVPHPDLTRVVIDLASLGSVRDGAARLAQFGPIDVLINNAGVMGTAYSRTKDGLELQLATNHFAPFLLTGLLLPQLAASGAGRVIAVASNAHWMARHAPLADPRAERPYRKWRVYAETKLANLLFTYELDRRATAAGLPVQAMAAHPGYSATALVSYGRFGRASGGAASILDAVVKATGQPAADGALPLLMAATADLPGTTYCGPNGRAEMRGSRARVVTSSGLSHDRGAQRQLWELSEETVGLRYP